MIVLHALWEIDKGLHLWAESSEALSGTTGRRKKGSQKGSHPFILPHSSLMKLAVSLSAKPDLSDTSPGNLTVLLPSTDDGPVPSEECLGSSLHDLAKDGQRLRLAPWQIDTLILAPGAALHFLSALESHPPGGVDFGSSWRFWTEMSKLSLELVARESFLPAIREEDQDGVPAFQFCLGDHH